MSVPTPEEVREIRNLGSVDAHRLSTLIRSWAARATESQVFAPGDPMPLQLTELVDEIAAYAPERKEVDN